MPRDEKSARRCARPSSQSLAEPVGSAPVLQPAATPITHGATLYGFSVFGAEPSLPDANTTVIPASCIAFVAVLIGSAASYAPVVPHELLTTRMPYCARCSRIQSMPDSAHRMLRPSPT